MIAVNYFAPWLLTRELLPDSLEHTWRADCERGLARRPVGTRALTIPGDLTDTAPFTARASSPLYGKSKLLDIMFTMELTSGESEAPGSQPMFWTRASTSPASAANSGSRHRWRGSSPVCASATPDAEPD